jgi:RNA polymerase sigma factor (sigma-70 family)
MSNSPQTRLDKIVRRCCQGHNDAWHELIELAGPVIFSICRRSKLTRDESFDIYGQVCYELVKSIKSLRESEKVLSVVATITRRQIYAYYQRTQMIEYLDEETVHHIADDCAADPEEIFEQAQRRQLLIEAMGDLREKDRRLLSALFLDPEEPSYKEIAASLSMPVSSIGPLRAKALSKLCQILKRKKLKF